MDADINFYDSATKQLLFELKKLLIMCSFNGSKQSTW